MSDSGGRPRSVTDEEIIAALRDSGERVLTTSEVADAVDVSRRTALRRLSELADAGRVGRKEINERAVVWWPLTPDDEQASAPAAPLAGLVGMLDADAAERARARSEAVREELDDRLGDA